MEIIAKLSSIERTCPLLVSLTSEYRRHSNTQKLTNPSLLSVEENYEIMGMMLKILSARLAFLRIQKQKNNQITIDSSELFIQTLDAFLNYQLGFSKNNSFDITNAQLIENNRYWYAITTRALSVLAQKEYYILASYFFTVETEKRFTFQIGEMFKRMIFVLRNFTDFKAISRGANSFDKQAVSPELPYFLIYLLEMLIDDFCKVSAIARNLQKESSVWTNQSIVALEFLARVYGILNDHTKAKDIQNRIQLMSRYLRE